ncbi:YdeI/OmpD-associated family protein [Ideonella sp. YS5]|uniref:YdeI/OmpD-associated family protein n=1 Tax=Ideonella sp. YS5 TaxID=3453714 RepID=UPI003EEB7B4F
MPAAASASRRTTDPATRDPRVDAYIAKAAPFARPLLASLREQVHAAHPGIVESIKWGMPYFLYGGRLLAGMAAFKAHATFGFWQGDQLAAAPKSGKAMGQFGRLTGPADLPAAARLQSMVRQAIALIDSGAPPRSHRRSTEPRPPVEVPGFLRDALQQHPTAAAHFNALAPGQQREYVDWLVEAKREDTRARRLAQALEWLAEGKRRNWKYENC